MSTTNQRSFNGTTITIGAGSALELVSAQDQHSATEIDVTQPEDEEQLVEIGQPSRSVTIAVKGYTTPAIGDSGALVLTRGNGDVKTYTGTYLVTNVSTSGTFNGVWEGSITIKRTVPAAA
jgi:hypothetical protein